jgi:hypothetical protein
MSAIAARSRYTDTVICFGSAKNALLYFDYVIPMNWLFEAIEHVSETQADNIDTAFSGLPTANEIWPPVLLNNRRFAKSYNRLWKASSLVGFKRERMEDGLPPWDEDDEMWTVFSPKQYDNAEGRWNTMFRAFISEYGLHNVPFDYVDLEATKPKTENAQVALSLAGLKIVDPARCSWEKLREFRLDKESRDGLRRLRLFAFEKYSGKDLSFIEDDLMTKVEDYDRVVRKWGLETTESAVTSFTESKAAVAGMAGAIIAIMGGHPGISAAALIGAGTLALGKVSVQIAKKSLELQTAAANNPVSYVTAVKKLAT